MAYDIICKMVQNEQVCDSGYNVGDEIRFDPSTCKLSLPRGRACLWALHDLVELMLELSHYIPSWAKKDENGDPYLTYRCTSLAPTWWEVRRFGEDKVLGPAGSVAEFEKKKELLRERHKKSAMKVDLRKWERYRY